MNSTYRLKKQEAIALREDGLQRCTKCLEIKLKAEFHRASAGKGTADGYALWCKSCMSLKHKECRAKRQFVMPLSKTCTCCQQEKSTTEFTVQRHTNGNIIGLQSRCKSCMADEMHQKNMSKNPNYRKEHLRRQEKRSLLSAGLRRCLACQKIKPVSSFCSHPTANDGLNSKCRSCAAAAFHNWRIQNPHKIRKLKKARYVREKSALGSFTGADVDRQIATQEGKCWWCGAQGKLTVDHIIPLAKGGTNYPSNLVMACRSCNSGKRDRLPHLWMGRLL